MALPKYKTSRANTHSRRANWKATAAATVNCPNGRVYREAVRSIHTK